MEDAPTGHPIKDALPADPAYKVFAKSADALKVAATAGRNAEASHARMLSNAAWKRHSNAGEVNRGNVPRHSRLARDLHALFGPTTPRDPESKGHKPKHARNRG